MAEYSWQILSLYTAPHENGLDNVVKKINWRYQIKEGSYYADLYLHTELTSPPQDSFIVYDNLTEETVFSWIESVENIEKLQNDLQEKLELVKSPIVIEKETPWNQESKYTGEEEYLIVFDDQPNDLLKIWGPMKWDSKRANKGLKERGVTNYEFPYDITMYQKGILPIDTPTIVNERVKIYKVEYTNSPELDGIFEYHEGLTWVTDSGKAVGTYFVLQRTVENVKKILNETLSNKSFQKQTSGVDITLQNKLIKVNTTLPSRLNLLQRYQLMNENDVLSCKLNDNDWLNLSKNEIELVLKSVENYISEVYSWEKNISDQIQSSTTLEQLKQIEV